MEDKKTEIELNEEQQNKNNSLKHIRSTVILALKDMLPKPSNGTQIASRIRKMGLTLQDVAFLFNRSVGGFYNLTSPSNKLYKKGHKDDDITLDIAITYLEKIYQEKKDKAKQEKQKEKERVLNTITGETVVSTMLSLRECNSLESIAKVKQAIYTLSQQGITKLSYKEVAEMTGLTSQQIAKIREYDKEIDDWFSYTDEVDYNNMQDKLGKIAEDNFDIKPSIAIKAIDTKMKYIKSNQKDKNTNDNTNTENIWDKFKNMKTIQTKEISQEILVIEEDN